MSPPDGGPAPTPDTDRVEYGRCTGCGDWAYGYFVEDLTASIARVKHCERDPSRLTAAAAVSVAAVVLVCVLLLTIWR
ncbi:hypothetical protein [Streptomyces sp. NRRL S-495]|uniref:hypothetical protein n=1 Tax=Streptomyces sp. NRRL S-495 TaxID=1609133 RepID=UPI0005F8A3B1|nr:hypothetical protein [Streptomyces sp. NRRL S-495]KJY32589.1 hypothetical protein VR45_22095 [Streptomyces sp. NRRL S-495]